MKCVCQLGLLALPFVVVNPATAAEKDLSAKGEALVRENCSRCHAIGNEGTSPHPQAPPFARSPASIRWRTSPNCSQRGSSQVTRICRYSCSARTTSRRSSIICSRSRNIRRRRSSNPTRASRRPSGHISRRLNLMSCQKAMASMPSKSLTISSAALGATPDSSKVIRRRRRENSLTSVRRKPPLAWMRCPLLALSGHEFRC